MEATSFGKKPSGKKIVLTWIVIGHVIMEAII